MTIVRPKEHPDLGYSYCSSSAMSSGRPSPFTAYKGYSGPPLPRDTKRAWLVLLTRTSNLPGVMVLAHTLSKHSSAYPLVVVTTPSLPLYAVSAIHACGLPTKLIAPLNPNFKVEVVADGSEDTWTKLAVWAFEEFETAVFLDDDMAIRRNMDELFDLDLGKGDWIAANHACVCNTEWAAWAPDDWREENCAYTGLQHPQALTDPTPVTTMCKRTHTLLNSGLIVLHPSVATFAHMHHFLLTSPLVPTFPFPVQDFLAEFFRGRWMPLGWQYNAVETMRYGHSDMWRDEEVRCLHYIVDKPWSVARGMAGEDETTHTWWWNEFLEWEAEMKRNGRKGVRAVMAAGWHRVKWESDETIPSIFGPGRGEGGQ